MSRTPHEHLVHFLSDMYSVEQQALAQLVSAPDMAGDPGLAAEFRRHHDETTQQAEKVRSRLEALGGSPSSVKDWVMKAGGKGFLLFAQMLPETPGRLVAHAYSYEAVEWAGYQILMRLARRVGDATSMNVAEEIADEEREMMGRLERGFDAAEAASHEEVPPAGLPEHLRTHLGEAHALEKQAIELMAKGRDIPDSSELARICERNLAAAQTHASLLESRLHSLEAAPSTLKDTAMRLGGWNWSLFFQAQSDTPAKLAAFAYAFEHLKIAGYELLMRTAARAQDAATQTLCANLIREERNMADEVAATFDAVVDNTLLKLQPA